MPFYSQAEGVGHANASAQFLAKLVGEIETDRRKVAVLGFLRLIRKNRKSPDKTTVRKNQRRTAVKLRPAQKGQTGRIVKKSGSIPWPRHQRAGHPRSASPKLINVEAARQQRTCG